MRSKTIIIPCLTSALFLTACSETKLRVHTTKPSVTGSTKSFNKVFYLQNRIHLSVSKNLIRKNGKESLISEFPTKYNEKPIELTLNVTKYSDGDCFYRTSIAKKFRERRKVVTSSEYKVDIDGRTMRHSNGKRFTITPEKGELFIFNYKTLYTNDAPDIVDILGDDRHLPMFSDVKIKKIHVQARISPDRTAEEEFRNWVNSKFIEICGNRPEKIETPNFLIQNHKPDTDWKSVSNAYYIDLKHIKSKSTEKNYRMVEFEAIDTLNELGIPSAIIDVSVSSDDVYNIENYKREVLSGVETREIQEFLLNLAPSDIKEKQKNRIKTSRPVMRLKKGKVRVNLTVRHRDYVAFKGAITLHGNEKLVTVRLERIGSVRRGATQQPRATIEIR